MTRIQSRRGTSVQWDVANTVLASGEKGFETDTGKFKIGDGVTTWSDLPYFINEGQSDEKYALKGEGGGGGAPLTTYSQVSGLDDYPATFPPSSHNHDELYHTKEQADVRFASAAHGHTQYAPTSSVYTKIEANARFAPINSSGSGLVPQGELAHNEEPPADAVDGSWWLRALDATDNGGGTTIQAVAFRAATADANGSTSTPNAIATLPAGVQAGDFMLAAWTCQSGMVGYTGPSGWTLVASQVAGSAICRVYSKVATASDAGSTITATPTYPTGTTAVRQEIQVVSYSSVAGVDGVSGNALGTGGTSVTLPTTTTTVDGCVRVGLAFDRISTTPGTTWNVPTGYTERDERAIEGNGGVSCVIGDNLTQVPAGTSVGAGVFAASQSTANAGSILVVLRPKVA